MADLEKHAIKRDPRFVVRLVLLLVVGVTAGVFLMLWGTSDGVTGCAARTLDRAAPETPAAPAPP